MTDREAALQASGGTISFANGSTIAERDHVRGVSTMIVSLTALDAVKAWHAARLLPRGTVERNKAKAKAWRKLDRCGKEIARHGL